MTDDDFIPCYRCGKPTYTECLDIVNVNGCDPLIITNSCAICPFLASRHKTKVTQKTQNLDINLDINGQVKE